MFPQQGEDPRKQSREDGQWASEGSAEFPVSQTYLRDMRACGTDTGHGLSDICIKGP